MLSYEADSAALRPFVPSGTELDEWNGHPLISLVGFLFRGTRVLGVPVPFHRDFDEVNLRFYVRRKSTEGWRRAVVFIQETVPSAAIAWTARTVYGESYRSAPMAHQIDFEGRNPRLPRRVSYFWKHRNQINQLEVRVEGDPELVLDGSLEEFVTEHYWGYSRGRGGATGTLEYRVEHPRWRCWTAVSSKLEGDFREQYGESLAAYLAGEPVSALLADGSEVRVYRPVRI